MSRRLPIALGAVGLLLVVAAALVKWVAAPALVKISLDKPNVTVSEGDATYLGKIKVLATRTVIQDDKATTGDVAVWDETLCLVNPAAQKLDADGCAEKSLPDSLPLKTTDRVAIDRKSAEAVNDAKFKTGINGDTSVKHEGVDYTFPLDTEKKTYRMFDAQAGKAYDAKYVGTTTIKGLKTYQFDTEVTDAPVTLIGQPATYSTKRSVWVEPTTGVIIKGVQQITEKLAGTAVFEGTVTFTDKTQQTQADLAKDSKNKIALIRWWVPLILLVLGVVLVGLAWFLGRRRPATAPAGPAQAPTDSSLT